MKSVLYISYDGLMEPLGQSQVLQYVTRLAMHHKITLVTYEKPDDWKNVSKRELLKKEVRSAGIHWVPLKYHKRFSVCATAYDICIGILVCSALVITGKISIVHARSYVPSVIAVFLKKVFGMRYIFDMRGFWADERIDGNIWPSDSITYKVAKWFERQFLLNADTVVSLTQAAVEIMKASFRLKHPHPDFKVIPTCTNLDLFTNTAGKSEDAGIGGNPFVLGYVGSVGTWYLLDEMIQFFKIFRKKQPKSKMLFLNRDDHATIRQRLKFFGLSEEFYEIKRVDHHDVAQEIKRMDAGIFFIKPAFSKTASCPTKLGEYLASGVPCIANTHIGDVDLLLNKEAVGVVTDCFDTDVLVDAADKLMALCDETSIGERCRKVAENYFSLETGVEKYHRIYNAQI